MHTYDSRDTPFGEGPWPCLNLACSFYHKEVISNVRIERHRKSGVPLGIFSCFCGFTYTRKGPDQHPQDRYRLISVRQYGEAWYRHVRLMRKNQKSFAEIGDMIGVSGNTISRQMRQEDEKRKKEREQKEQVRKKRTALFAILIQNGTLSRQELKTKDIHLYQWLLRYDGSWFQGTMPTRKHVPASVKHSHVSWEERDETYLLSVQEVVEKLRKTVPPVRITRHRIGVQLGNVSRFYQWVPKLPKTKAYLEQSVETMEMFHIRKVRFVAEELREKGTKLSETSIRDRGHLWTPCQLPFVVQEEIRKQMYQ
ncbi:TnsD family Tn7-like transposition protein [Bacillus sp. S14(2024)]|uniref:TnsD family Tn7-like transposition protein n=1 Tax=Bacillus sp. S14(2024) TaxID=3162884 RepID=UPI003D1FBD36